MGEVINLRSRRKQKARADKAAQAEQNRIQNGLPKHLKSAASALQELHGRQLDGLKLDKARTGEKTNER